MIEEEILMKKRIENQNILFILMKKELTEKELKEKRKKNAEIFVELKLKNPYSQFITLKNMMYDIKGKKSGYKMGPDGNVINLENNNENWENNDEDWEDIRTKLLDKLLFIYLDSYKLQKLVQMYNINLLDKKYPNDGEEIKIQLFQDFHKAFRNVPKAASSLKNLKKDKLEIVYKFFGGETKMLKKI